MPLFRLGDKQPQLGDNAWVAPNATLIGDIRLGANASIWWNATLRGDNDPIHIGDNTNIQDGSVLHTDEGVPMHIGNNVTVGHLVMLHGCTVGDGSLIGIGSVILNRAVIGAGAMGSGIGQVAAMAGHEVILFDAFPNAVTKARDAILLSLNKLAEKGKITDQETKAVFGRMYFVDQLQSIEGSDLVIEANSVPREPSA